MSPPLNFDFISEVSWSLARDCHICFAKHENHYILIKDACTND
jgi:hypothetical protein